MWDKEFIILRTSGTWKETSENIVRSFGESIGKFIIGTIIYLLPLASKFLVDYQKKFIWRMLLK
jgi:hypothetical protein